MSPSHGRRVPERLLSRPGLDGHDDRERPEPALRPPPQPLRIVAIAGPNDDNLFAGRRRRGQRRRHQRHAAALRAQPAAEAGDSAASACSRQRDVASDVRQHQACCAPRRRWPKARRRRTPPSRAPARAGPARSWKTSRRARCRQTASSWRSCSVDGPLQPARLARGLEQLQQAPDQVGVVLGEAVDGRLAAAIAAPQHPPVAHPTARAGGTRAACRAAARWRAPGCSPASGCSSASPPSSTRAARAAAAIISPFQAVSTLSSRSGRGRLVARLEQR